MHDFCVCVCVCVINMLQYVQKIAVGVHFIVWRLSPILKGALYIRSGVLDGAKNLSLRAVTNSQCIVGDPSGVWNEHAQTRREFYMWVM